METFPSYSTMVDNARMMEMGKKTREDFQKKCKRGFEGKSLGQGETLGAFKTLNSGKTLSVAPSTSV